MEPRTELFKNPIFAFPEQEQRKRAKGKHSLVDEPGQAAFSREDGPGEYNDYTGDLKTKDAIKDFATEPIDKNFEWSSEGKTILSFTKPCFQ